MRSALPAVEKTVLSCTASWTEVSPSPVFSCKMVAVLISMSTARVKNGAPMLLRGGHKDENRLHVDDLLLNNLYIGII
jgi:hypothetical protein